MPPVGSASRVNSSRPRRLVTFSKRERHDRNKRKPVIFLTRHDDSSDSGSDSGSDSESDSDSDSDDDSEDEKLEDVKKDKQVKGSNNIGESVAAGDKGSSQDNSPEPGSALSPFPPPDGTGVDPPGGTGVGDTSIGADVGDTGAATAGTGTKKTSITTATDSASATSSNINDDGGNGSTDTETSNPLNTIPGSTSSSAASMTSPTVETSPGTSSVEPIDDLSGASVTSMYSGVAPTTGLTPSSTDAEYSPDSTKLAPSFPSHSHPNAGAIAGGIIGGLVFLSLLVFGIFIILRRRKNRTAPSAEFLFVHPREYSPFSADSRFQRIGSPAPSFLSSSASSLAPHRGLGEPPPFTPGRFQNPFPEKAPLG